MSTFSLGALTSRINARKAIIKQLEERKAVQQTVWDKLTEMDPSSETAFHLMRAGVRLELLSSIIDDIEKLQAEDDED